MKRLYCLFALLTFSLFWMPALAQEDDGWGDFGDDEEVVEKGKISGGILHIPFSFLNSSQGPLAQSLVGQGYPAPSDEVLSWGSDITVVVRNFVLSFGTQRNFAQSLSNGTYSMELNHQQTELGLGHLLYAKRGFLLYPRALFGWTNQNFEVVAQNGSGSFDNGVQGGFLGSEMDRKSYYLGADVGADYMFGYDETSGAGLCLGLRVGYQHQITSGDWTSYGRPVTDGPDLDLSGLFVRFSIGFAGWHRQ